MAQVVEFRRPGWKMRELEELADLFKQFRVVAVFDLTGLRANIIHEMRKILRGSCVIRVAKKKLFIKACELAGRPELKALVEDVKGPIGFIMSSIDSFKLSTLLEKSKVPMFAKAGERADFDVWVSETNTGLPPGPILSDFGKMKIPTRIEGGQVWIARDTKVASKGDVISDLLASMLVKLGVKAVLRGLTIRRAYEDGLILREEHLRISLEDVLRDIISTYALALALAAGIGYVTSETVAPMLSKSFREAIAVAVTAGYVTGETLGPVLGRAEREALHLASILETKQ